MHKIPSFEKDHDAMQPGLHFSTLQKGVMTLDLRFKKPNAGDYVSPAALHSVEHMLATALRNGPQREHVLYFGPMGCRTGFYLLLAGELYPRDVAELVGQMFRFIRDFTGPVPGAQARDCGNYLDMNLPMARYWAGRYLDNTLARLDDAHMQYPQ